MHRPSALHTLTSKTGGPLQCLKPPGETNCVPAPMCPQTPPPQPRSNCVQKTGTKRQKDKVILKYFPSPQSLREEGVRGHGRLVGGQRGFNRLW